MRAHDRTAIAVAKSPRRCGASSEVIDPAERSVLECLSFAAYPETRMTPIWHG